PAPNTYPTGLADTMAAPAADPDPNIDSCYPAGSTYNQDSTAYGADYDKRINYLDVHTVRQADLLKAQNTEIFVVGFGVDATDPGTTCDAAMRARLGTYSGRDRADGGDPTQGDREVAKCIASSKVGTNDHYFEANATGLSNVFTSIAKQISFRLLK